MGSLRFADTWRVCDCLTKSSSPHVHPTWKMAGESSDGAGALERRLCIATAAAKYTMLPEEGSMLLPIGGSKPKVHPSWKSRSTRNPEVDS